VQQINTSEMCLRKEPSRDIQLGSCSGTDNLLHIKTITGHCSSDRGIWAFPETLKVPS